MALPDTYSAPRRYIGAHHKLDRDTFMARAREELNAANITVPEMSVALFGALMMYGALTPCVFVPHNEGDNQGIRWDWESLKQTMMNNWADSGRGKTLTPKAWKLLKHVMFYARPVSTAPEWTLTDL